MNDEKLEQFLRDLPSPELPAAWQAEILSEARRAAREPVPRRQVWPTILVYARSLCLRNPITATAMAAIWVLIFFLKVSTPIDPHEKLMLAHFDPNRPVYLASLRDEVLMVQLALDQPEERPLRQMP